MIAHGTTVAGIVADGRNIPSGISTPIAGEKIDVRN